jgi:hypothetical protein
MSDWIIEAVLMASIIFPIAYVFWEDL